MVVRSRLDPDARLGLRLTLIVVAFVLIAIPFAIVLLEVLYRGPLTDVDQPLAIELNEFDLTHPSAVQVARIVTIFGATLILTAIVIVATLYLAMIHERRRQAMFLVTTAVLGTVVNNLIKVVVDRSRPHFEVAVAHAFGKSFPSGHAMNSTVVYGALLVLLWSRLRTRRARLSATLGAAMLILAIAASRLVLGVHYLSDVLAGIILGTAFVLASAAAFRTWRREGGHLPAAIDNAPTLGELAHDAEPTPHPSDDESNPPDRRDQMPTPEGRW